MKVSKGVNQPVLTKRVEAVSEDLIWSEDDVEVWQASRCEGVPFFYPIYKWADCYSFSPVLLARLKGCVKLNERFLRQVDFRQRPYYSGVETFDNEICRIGGEQTSDCSLRDARAYAEALANAVKADLRYVEARLPNRWNLVLCGGKDSLNLLLLPWRSNVLVLSAEPNLPLVREFVRRNKIPYEVRALTDDDKSTFAEEVLYNACSLDLRHCRWTGALKTFSKSVPGKAIFWGGQLGSTVMTPNWRRFFHYRNRCDLYLRRAIDMAARTTGMSKVFASYQQRRAFHSLWSRAAMWQGTHMGVLRAVCGSPVLSAYHGPETRNVVLRANLASVASTDVRPLIGEILRGAPVWYPSANPGPPVSVSRIGLSDPGRFVAALRTTGLTLT